MASGDLFRAFTVRFSLKKGQHERMLQKIEDRKLNDGKSKNQVVMDTLEMYYNSLENDSDTKEDRVITEQLLEQWLMTFRQEFREEMLWELLNIFVSGMMAGQPTMVPSLNGESQMEDVKEDGAADISGMSDVMDKIMSWSDS